MKKKLLSIISIAMAMTMTVSTFAATPRGAGDVDGDGKITANDVLMILKGLADTNPEANVDGRNGINGSDANVLYRTILQPKTVSEDLMFKAYTENYSLGKNPVSIIEGADKLGSTVVAGDKGMGVVDDAVSTTSDTTIKGAIDSLVNLVNESSAANISSQLDKIYFASATKGDVYLRAEDGWSMFCYAVQPIIPMDAETAAICNKVPSSEEDLNNPTLKERYDALKEIKALVVSDKTLTANDIKTIKEAAYRAFPADMTETEIKEAAQRVLDIVATKFTLTAEIKGNVETITPDGAFVNGLVSLAQYDTKTMADYRNTFGDKLVISVTNNGSGNTISAVFEVAVVANAGSTPVEPTTVTEATTEATTATEATTVTEATTEATTATEATTEAPTETTTEAVSGFVGDVNVLAENLQTAFPTGLVDGDVLVKDAISIINSGSAFGWKSSNCSFNDGAFVAACEFQVGNGNASVSADHAVGDVLADTESIEKAIKLTVGGSGKVTVYAALGSSGVAEAPIYLVDLNTRKVVAVSSATRPGGSGTSYYVSEIEIPAAGQYAYMQPGKKSSLNVAKIDLSIK